MKRRIRIISLSLLCCFLYQLLFPIAAYALTGGPSQPEVESFEPVGTSEMVDLFSGDFNYNIPLMDVDGYPINIAYHSGVTMDQEASWVGLGWNLNPGVINRNMRGIPDDFQGDQVEKTQYVKPDRTYGGSLGIGIELFGKSTDKLKKFLEKIGANARLDVNLGINYNNYRGLGIESSITPAITANDQLKNKTPLQAMGFNAKLAIASSSKDGFSIKPQAGMRPTLASYGNLEIANNTSIGMSVSSRGGVKSLTFKSGISASASRISAVTGKKEELTGGNITNGGVAISFGTQTYTPAIGMQFENMNVSFLCKMGLAISGIDPSVSISGYYAGQEVAETHPKRGAYGALYAQVAPDDDAMMDFNREKDGSFSANNPTLAIPIFTYDLYTATGQGVGGMFKPYRNDLPVMHDPNMSNVSKGGSLGVELGSFSYLKMGLNPSFNYSEIRSGAWNTHNDLKKRFYYTSKSVNSPFHEPVYFKNIGEKQSVNTGTLPYHNIGQPLRPVLSDIAPILATKDVFVKSDQLAFKAGDQHVETDIRNVPSSRPERDKRNQLMSYLTVAEKDYCLEKEIGYRTDNLTLPIDRYDTIKRKQHHLTEISILNDRGSRYVYGVPAYNNKQYDISFTNAIDPDNTTEIPGHDCLTGQSNYDYNLNFDSPALEARKFKGNDHGMNITRTPGYAHSYLLTAVLSPDYVDVNQNGPDAGDYGSYTKLSYKRVSDAYKWRVPYNERKANYSEGLKSDLTDDNANIIYGEKEIWLLKQIEGRNHYAKFILSPREDGLGVKGWHGGKDVNAKSYKLDRIELYSIKDSITPVKTVHFEYSYELCQKVDNNTDPYGGKLTLKKLYFTYGKSTKGRFNAYEFNYDGPNPDYNIKSYDRWGNYKPNSCSGDNASSVDYPYVDQDKATTDPRTAAWSLTSVALPSGGVIKIVYESDDYAFVQNKRAMQMAKIKGFADYSAGLQNASQATPVLSNNLYEGTDPRECVFFDLPASMKTEEPGLIKKYLLESTGNLLYYNCLVNLNSEAQGNNREYVRGYTEVWDAGVINMGGANPVGWIRVKLQDDDESHPISKTAWQYARMYMPQLVYPGSNLRKKSEGRDVAEAMIRGMFGFIFDAIDMIDGVNNKLRREHKGQYVDVANSWIRINNMTGKKLGGGTRVKQLLLEDRWSELSAESNDKNYGQEYSYETKEFYNGVDRLISSGVASYEPTIGNDENPFKSPVAYSNNNIGVPNDEFYSEEPFGEAYFPAPQVGYSRVTVKNIIPSGVNLNRHGTGKVVHEFYTAREFPTLTSRTGIDSKQYEVSAIFKILGFMGEQHMAMTQGYQVELNDMHGKPKGVYNYIQSKVESTDLKDAFSGVKYEYNVEDESAPQKKLSSSFQVINANNQISTGQVGVEADMILDTREQTSKTFSGGLKMNLEIVAVPAGPVPIPITITMGWPDFSSEFTSFRSAVIMRVVNRFGVLKKTIAFEEGSNVATENVLLDAETGEIVLTRTYNEYNDPVYNMTFPAHWAYNGMGQAYKNAGLEAEIINHPNVDSVYVFKVKVNGQQADAWNYFADGDEVIVTEKNSSGEALGNYKRWVFVRAGSYYLIDDLGSVRFVNNIFGSTQCIAKVIRSGRRNMQNTPVMQFASLANPAKNGSSLVLDTSTKTINASAVSFSDKWRTTLPESKKCNPGDFALQLTNVFNFLVATGQLSLADSANSATKIINTGLPGATAYTNSFIPGILDPAYNPNNQFNTVVASYSNPRNFGFSIPVASGGYVVSLTMFIPSNWKPIRLINFSPNSNTFTGAGIGTLEYQVAGITYSAIISVGIQMSFPVEPVCDCKDKIGSQVNPFLSGIKGSWRRQKDWVYYDSRNPQAVSAGNATNIRKDGTYSTFASFWVTDPLSAVKWKETATKGKWTQTNEVTKYGLLGYETENKDAIGRYASAVYGYKNTLPVCVASNAAYAQIGFDGCEEPVLLTSPHSCAETHLDFGVDNLLTGKISSKSHTGVQSYMLAEGEVVNARHRIVQDNGIYNNGRFSYLLDKNDLNGFFNPSPGKYVTGAWVKVGSLPKAFTYANADTTKSCRIEIRIEGAAPVTYHARPSGPIIEGWQRIEKVFDVPVGATSITLKLVAADEPGTTAKTWFDDMRVHPYDARMKSYVYDPRTLKLIAELDENNYATFYEYDLEGLLLRVKRETEKGIVTVKESRSHQHKK